MLLPLRDANVISQEEDVFPLFPNKTQQENHRHQMDK